MNDLLKDAGITFIYFKRFTMIESESMLFARFTPGYNFTWFTPNKTMSQPHLLDLNSFAEDQEEPTTARGIEMQMN